MLGPGGEIDGPARLGRWTLGAPLGEGGMGVVREAVDDRGRTAAIKTVRAFSPAMVAGLRREIDALAGADHPGVVRVLDHGVDDGVPWVAMERVRGKTLRAAYLWTPSSADA